MNTKFKEEIIKFNDAKEQLKFAKRQFETDVIIFMEKQGIPVRVLFFGDTFGIDIRVSMRNHSEVPHIIPLKVLSAFCDEFGCDFVYTCCDGNRWIFTFDKLSMRSLE